MAEASPAGRRRSSPSWMASGRKSARPARLNESPVHGARLSSPIPIRRTTGTEANLAPCRSLLDLGIQSKPGGRRPSGISPRLCAKERSLKPMKWQQSLAPPALFHDAGLVAVPVAVAAGGAFVEILLALANADQKLGLAMVVEEQFERHDRIAGAGHFLIKL